MTTAFLDEFNKTNIYTLPGFYFMEPGFGEPFTTLISPPSVLHHLSTALKGVNINRIDDVTAPQKGYDFKQAEKAVLFARDSDIKIAFLGESVRETKENLVKSSMALVPYMTMWLAERIARKDIPFDLYDNLVDENADFKGKLHSWWAQHEPSQKNIKDWLTANYTPQQKAKLVRKLVHNAFDFDEETKRTNIGLLENFLTPFLKERKCNGMRLCGYTRVFRDYATQNGHRVGSVQEVFDAHQGSPYSPDPARFKKKPTLVALHTPPAQKPRLLTHMKHDA